MAEALYRKYRPQIFEDVVGQEPIERTLRNALLQDKVSHAYLFCGPRGTGKTTTARLLAKALLCVSGPTPEPDGTCEECKLIADGEHPDVYELDAASRTGVDNVREEIIGRVQFAPTRGKTKVYIVDEVHMLSTAAFNALLKTLEEPPDHVVFILCTTDPQKVPETIHSRCQRFDFRRIDTDSMVARLGAICVAEDVEFEGEALDLIAHRAEGGLRNALTSLEQIIAFEGGKVTLAGAEHLLGSIDSNDLAELMATIGQRDIAGCLRWTADYVETGSDLAQFVRDLSDHIRDLYVMSVAGEEVGIDISETLHQQMIRELTWFGTDRLARCMGVIGDLSVELKTSSNPRLSFEIALTRLVRPESDLTLESLAERIEALEAQCSALLSGSGAMGASPVREAPSATGASFATEAPSATEVPPAAEVPPAVETPSVTEVPSAVEASSITEVPSADTPQQSVAFLQGDLNDPAYLQRLWHHVMAFIKRKKIAYGALFMNTRVSFDKGNSSIAVEFPKSSEFAFKAVQKPETVSLMHDALQQATGRDVAVVFQLAQDEDSSLPNQTSVHNVQEQEIFQQEVPDNVQDQPIDHQNVAELQGALNREVLQEVPAYDDVSDNAPDFAPDDIPDDVYESYNEPFAQNSDRESSIGAIASVASGTQDSSKMPMDLQAVLEAGFGDGIYFEEID